MQKWEYMILPRTWGEERGIQERLNKLGDEGWELVGVERVEEVFHKHALLGAEKPAELWVADIFPKVVFYYLKRPKG